MTKHGMHRTKFAFSMLAASGINGLVVAASLPVLSRIYAAEAYGMQGLVVATTAVFSVSGALRFEQGIIQATNPQSVARYVRLSLAASALLAAVVAVVAYRRFGSLAEYGHVDNALNLTALSLLFFVLSVIALIGEAINIYTESGSQIIACSVIKSLSMITGQVAFGFAGLERHGLILGQIAGMGMYIAGLFVALPQVRFLFGSLSELVSVRSISEVLRQFWEEKRFPFLLATQSSVSYLSHTLPIWILGQTWSIETIGVFWMCQRLLLAPHQLIGSIVRNAFTRFLVSKQRSQASMSGRQELIVLSAGLTVISTGIAAILLWKGGLIVKFVLGGRWIGSLDFIEALLPWWIALMASSPSLAMIRALRKDGCLLLSEIVLLIAKLAYVYFAATRLPPVQLVFGLSVISAIGCIFVVVFASTRKTAEATETLRTIEA